AYRPKRSERSVPPESFLGALSVGIRFVRHSPDFQAVLFRSGAFVFFVVVFWALLPLTSRSLVRTTATGYGLLLGALGVGAVMGGLLLLSLRRRFGPERPTLVATLAYAGAIAGLSQAPPLGVAVVLMLLCGAAWSIVLSTMSVSAQILLPSWVRARGLAASMSMIFGSMGVGSLVWGVLCTRVGLPATLEVAAFGLVLAHGTSFFFRLPRGEGPNLEPAKIRPLPSYSTEIAGDEGPVLILVEYDVASEDELAFGEAAANLRAVRMRSGALSWNLYRDPDRPGYYVEAFLDRSWHDHLRLHHRATMADRAVEDEVLSFHRGQMPPVTHHLVAAMKLPTTRLGNA
ncbi:MAG: MFS transporter, partial [Polyangiaceae bacterium]|nr:MFS transporter [Polyangiaceae bacterium]